MNITCINAISAYYSKKGSGFMKKFDENDNLTQIFFNFILIFAEMRLFFFITFSISGPPVADQMRKRSYGPNAGSNMK
jgi:hypothetical protein